MVANFNAGKYMSEYTTGLIEKAQLSEAHVQEVLKSVKNFIRKVSNKGIVSEKDAQTFIMFWLKFNTYSPIQDDGLSRSYYNMMKIANEQ